MARPEQPQRIRLVASSDAFVERRRNRRRSDEDYSDELIDIMPVVTKVTSHAEVYWHYLTLFVLFSALGGVLVAAFGLFEEIGR